MPAPTTDTLLTLLDAADRRPEFRRERLQHAERRCQLGRAGTVKPMVALPPLPTFWAIMSTTMFVSATAAKMRWLTPGRSGTPSSTIRASSRDQGRPADRHLGHPVRLGHDPGALGVAERVRTMTGTSNFLANSMDRECMTPAPTLASSSISS